MVLQSTSTAAIVTSASASSTSVTITEASGACAGSIGAIGNVSS